MAEKAAKLLELALQFNVARRLGRVKVPTIRLRLYPPALRKACGFPRRRQTISLLFYLASGKADPFRQAGGRADAQVGTGLAATGSCIQASKIRIYGLWKRWPDPNGGRWSALTGLGSASYLIYEVLAAIGRPRALGSAGLRSVRKDCDASPDFRPNTRRFWGELELPPIFLPPGPAEYQPLQLLVIIAGF